MAKRQRTGEFGPVVRWLDEEAGASGDPPPAWAVELVESAHPLSVPIALKQRMLLSLGNGRPRPGQPWLRPLVVCAVLLSGTAVASAAFTGWPANTGARLSRAGRGPCAGAGHRAGRRSARPAGGPACSDRRRHGRRVCGPRAAGDPPPDRGQPPARQAPRGPARILRWWSRRRARCVSIVTRVARACWRASTCCSIRAASWRKRRWRSRSRPRWIAADADVGSAAARYLSLYPHGAFRAVAERALSAR